MKNWHHFGGVAATVLGVALYLTACSQQNTESARPAYFELSVREALPDRIGIHGTVDDVAIPPAFAGRALDDATTRNARTTPKPLSKPMRRSEAKISDRKISPKKKKTIFLREVSKILIGMTADEVSLILGPAKSSTILMPSKIVEYQFPKCHLKLYFYPDLLTEVFRVLRIEANATAGDRKKAPYCSPEHVFQASFEPFT